MKQQGLQLMSQYTVFLLSSLAELRSVISIIFSGGEWKYLCQIVFKSLERARNLTFWLLKLCVNRP